MISDNPPPCQPAILQASTNNLPPRTTSFPSPPFGPSNSFSHPDQHHFRNTTNSSLHHHRFYNPCYSHSYYPYQYYSHTPQSSSHYLYPIMSHSTHPSAPFASSSEAPCASPPHNFYCSSQLPTPFQPPHRDYSSSRTANLRSSPSPPGFGTGHGLYPSTISSTPFQLNQTPSAPDHSSFPVCNEVGFAVYSAAAFNPHIPYSADIGSEPHQPYLPPSSMHYPQPPQPPQHPPLLKPPHSQQPIMDPLPTLHPPTMQSQVPQLQDRLSHVYTHQAHDLDLPHPQVHSPHTHEQQYQQPNHVFVQQPMLQQANKLPEQEKSEERNQMQDTTAPQLQQRQPITLAANSFSRVQHTSDQHQEQDSTPRSATATRARTSRVNDTETKDEVTQAELEALKPSEKDGNSSFFLRTSYQTLSAYYISEKKNMPNEGRQSIFSYADLLHAYNELSDYILDVATQRCTDLVAEARIPNLQDTTITRLEDETEEEIAGKRVVKLKYQEAVEKLQSNQIPAKRKGNLPKEGTEYLKKWFHDHYDYPYPTDQEKEQISKQAKIPVFQLSHWFINYRKRVWKPSLPPDHISHIAEGAKEIRKKAKRNGSRNGNGDT